MWLRESQMAIPSFDVIPAAAGASAKSTVFVSEAIRYCKEFFITDLGSLK
jgi:hypothetical protein